jgi:hypothetical protein
VSDGSVVIESTTGKELVVPPEHVAQYLQTGHWKKDEGEHKLEATKAHGLKPGDWVDAGGYPHTVVSENRGRFSSLAKRLRRCQTAAIRACHVQAR